jgi:uncharacterized protein YwbE
VGTIAQGLLAAGLAATEKHPAGFRRIILYWRDARAFVGTIAEGLLCAFAAGAPKIRLTSSNVGRVRGFLGNNRVRHCHFLPLSACIAWVFEQPNIMG